MTPVLALGTVRLLTALGISAILVVMDSYVGWETVVEVERTPVGAGVVLYSVRLYEYCPKVALVANQLCDGDLYLFARRQTELDIA